MFEIVDGRTHARTDGRTDDGRTPEHGYTVSPPCEPEGSGELKKSIHILNQIHSGSRVMSIFTIRARPAKMMLGEDSSPLFIPVAGQC